jgi:hypothetical protein
MTTFQKSAKKTTFPGPDFLARWERHLLEESEAEEVAVPWGVFWKQTTKPRPSIPMSHFPLGLRHISQQNTVTNEIGKLVHIQFFNQKDNKIYSFKLLSTKN